MILRGMGRGLGRGLALTCLLVAACLTAPAAPAATAGAATLTATPASVGGGQSVDVSWQGVTSPTSTDWVGLYRQGAADASITFWFFTATCTSSSGTAAAAGSCPVRMPTTTGAYEFRLFANNGYTRLATSGQVTVGAASPPDTSAPSVSLTAPAAGSAVSGSVQLAATATDNVGVSKVDFLVNGSVVATDTTSPYGATWDSTAVPNGQAQLAARATDAAGNTTTSTARAVTVQNVPGDPVLLAAGDIASCASPGDEATASILSLFPIATVATLGDNAYDHGTAAEFQYCYDPSWGVARPRTRPSVGNHDYDTAGASGYFGYFGAAAGPPARGWYSYDLGSWHIVVLNSNCWAVGGCGVGSAQETWLQSDLAAHQAQCTLAYWHHPLFTSGWVGNDTEMAPIWRDLQARRAAVILNGHAHLYERFAPQNSAGAADPNGPREFIVGTGGEDLHGLGPIAANSVVLNDVTLGVLKLTLHPGSYEWQFLPAPGQQFTDAGSAACPSTSTPAPSVSLTAPAAGSTVSGSVQLAATATDNAGVAKVDFLVNGSVVATDTTAPYQATWNSTAVANGQVQLAARETNTAGATTVSTVQTITVQNAPPSGTTLTATPSAVRKGQSVTVSWQGVASPTSADWVGLYRQGAADTSIALWFFTATCTSSTGPPRAAGSCAVRMPTTKGPYELRLFANNGYTRLATSSPITVS